MADFPEGMLLTLVTVDTLDFGANANEVMWEIQPETPAVWQATGFIFNDALIPQQLKNGHGEMWLPQTDQVGFIDPETGEQIINFAYRSFLKPTRSKEMSTSTFRLPASAGTPVKLGNLTNIGAWPNSQIIYVPGGETADYIEIEPGFWQPTGA